MAHCVTMALVSQTLRDRKKEQTRRDIAGAGLELMARHGFGATTMAAIAEAADVSRRTVFRYFADKEEVVFADDADHTEVLLAAVDAAPAGMPPLEVLRQAGHALAVELGRDAKDIVRWREVVATEPALQARYLIKQRRWEILVAERLAARQDGAPAALAAKIGIACMQAAFDAWIADPAGRSLGDRLDDAFAALPELLAQPPRPAASR